MRALGTRVLATLDHLAAQLHVRLICRIEYAAVLQPGSRQNEQTAELGLLHLSDCFENITINRHNYPYAGTEKSRAMGERRSVSVQPTGALSRAA